MYTVYRSPDAFYECLISPDRTSLYYCCSPKISVSTPGQAPPPFLKIWAEAQPLLPPSNFIFIAKLLLTGFRAFLQINFPWVFPDFPLFSSIFPLSSGDKKYIIFNDNVEGNILTNESMFYLFFDQNPVRDQKHSLIPIP